MASNILTVPTHIVSESITCLRDAGVVRKERVVLWLAKNCDDQIQVTEVFVPDQVADEDFFRIPPTSMSKILSRLRDSGLCVGAQVHSHPYEAFHSAADDQWAIVRHVGALSIVVPYFAKHTFPGNFVQQTALFSLSAHNCWEQVPSTRAHLHYRIVP